VADDKVRQSSGGGGGCSTGHEGEGSSTKKNRFLQIFYKGEGKTTITKWQKRENHSGNVEDRVWGGVRIRELGGWTKAGPREKHPEKRKTGYFPDRENDREPLFSLTAALVWFQITRRIGDSQRRQGCTPRWDIGV